MTGNLEDFFSSMHAMIGVICQKTGRKEEGPEESRIIAYIQQHAFENSISLDSIAEAFCISPRHLSRLIRNLTGVTYKEYLTQLRLARAIELAEGDLSTAEIATRVGYADEHYFMKLFREQMGCTISRYRMRQRSAAKE